MSRKKKIKRLARAQGRADRAVAKAWRARAKVTGRDLDRSLRSRSLAKSAPADPFEQFLMRKAAAGDTSARELLQKRGADWDPRYRAYLERVATQAQSGEVRSGAAAELARLDGDGSAAPAANWRWTAW